MLNTERAFAIKIGLGILLGLVFTLWTALQQRPRRFGAWVDVYLATALGAIIGARAGYVLLHWGQFAGEPLLWPRLWYGEIAWQGALIAGGGAMLLACRWRGVDFRDFSDAAALALPAVFMAICWAARSAGLILGEGVADLSQHPVWMAAFLPDISRDVAPRYELQMLGLAMGGGLLAIAGGLTLANRLAGLRLWITLAGLALAILILEDYSGRPPQTLGGVKVEQVSAAALWVIAFGAGVAQASVNRLANKRPQSPEAPL
jgi:prolipoprotein diacylglyceryltransferase